MKNSKRSYKYTINALFGDTEEERAAGFESGIEQGTLNTLIDLVKSENLNIEIAAEKAGMTVPDFVKLCEKNN